MVLLPDGLSRLDDRGDVGRDLASLRGVAGADRVRWRGGPGGRRRVRGGPIEACATRRGNDRNRGRAPPEVPGPLGAGRKSACQTTPRATGLGHGRPAWSPPHRGETAG